MLFLLVLGTSAETVSGMFACVDAKYMDSRCVDERLAR